MISCDKGCQWLAVGRWFSPGTPVFSTNNTGCHNITDILLKVTLNTISLTLILNCMHNMYLLSSSVRNWPTEYVSNRCWYLPKNKPFYKIRRDVDDSLIKDNYNSLVLKPDQTVTFGRGGRRGRDWMVGEFTTTYAISAYHHLCCEFESRSGRDVQHYVIKFVSDLRQVGGFPRVLLFPPPIKLTATV